MLNESNQTENSRVSNSIRNSIFGLLSIVITTLMSFVVRKVFLDSLGPTYLGINGLMTNVISFLSLAELGIGTAMVYSLYKPVAFAEKEKIKSLLHLYKRLYFYIFLAVICIGFILSFFIAYFTKEEIPHDYLRNIMLIYVLNSGLTYLFTYKKTILLSDQKQYVVKIVFSISSIVLQTLRLLILIFTQSFVLYLICQTILTLLENIFWNLYIDRKYPFLQEKNITSLPPAEKTTIIQNIKALFFHKIGTFIVFSTDNIIISYFVGIVQVGLYSNYVLIVSALSTLIDQVISSTTASLGNLLTKESKEKFHEVFNAIDFMGYAIYSYCAVSLAVLIQPFIQLWLGSSFTTSNLIVAMIILNFYITGARLAIGIVQDSGGIFAKDKYVPIVESVLNLALSIVFVKKFGVAGVLMGTLLSTILTVAWTKPFIVFKYIFGKNVRLYFLKHGLYIVITAISTMICITISGAIFTEVSILTFLGKAILCVLIHNSINILIFRKTPEFQFLWRILKRYTLKRRYIRESTM